MKTREECLEQAEAWLAMAEGTYRSDSRLISASAQMAQAYIALAAQLPVVVPQPGFPNVGCHRCERSAVVQYDRDRGEFVPIHGRDGFAACIEHLAW